MDSEQRQHFWQTLCSLKGENPIEDMKALAETIIVPEFLYRYRPVTVSSVDALQRNLLFYSNANYYDDPFDTLIHTDFKKINESVIDYFTNRVKPEDMISFGEQLNIPDKNISAALEILQNITATDLVNEIDDYLKKNIQVILKKNLWSACLSECGNNEVMWLKYADQYKGFCVVYDMKDKNKLLCGKQEYCQNCIVTSAGTSLYPIYYSDKGYDATEYTKRLTTGYIALNHLNNEAAKAVIEAFPIKMWEQERIALTKSKCHEYDQEWRFLLRSPSPGPIMQEWIPYGVILGLKMGSFERELIIRSAQMAGVDHVFELFITNEYELDFREINK